MIADIWTMMRKEWREYFAGAGAGGSGRGRGRGVIGVLAIVGVISVLLALQNGKAWFTSPAPIIVDGLYLPVTILLNVIADSFAGERERHTLETLLASRLSDRAILFGKVGAAVGYGWTLGLVGALVQAVVANAAGKGTNAAAAAAAGPSAGIAFYPPSTIVAIAVLGVLSSLLASSAGTLISLRAATTRQAQQILGFGFLVLVFVPIIVIQLLPRQTQSTILTALNSASPTQVFFIIVAVLLVLDLILLGVALLRFRRTRLILD